MSTRSPTALYGYVYCLRCSFGPQKNNLKSSTCTIKKLSDSENINLKMTSFLWQGNLPNRASKMKRLLARHDNHLSRASGQVLSYTSAIVYAFIHYYTIAFLSLTEVIPSYLQYR